MNEDQVFDNENIEQLPNYEELKKAANRTSNWRERLNAVEQLGEFSDEKTIHILKRIAAEDAVYQVRMGAYNTLRDMGEKVPTPAKSKGELIKGTSKILLRIKKSLPEGHTIEEFKEKLKKTRIDLYDTYEGDKEAEFDQWLTDTWASLVTRRSN